MFPLFDHTGKDFVTLLESNILTLGKVGKAEQGQSQKRRDSSQPLNADTKK